jgi:hypothetical protein
MVDSSVTWHFRMTENVLNSEKRAPYAGNFGRICLRLEKLRYDAKSVLIDSVGRPIRRSGGINYVADARYRGFSGSLSGRELSPSGLPFRNGSGPGPGS